MAIATRPRNNSRPRSSRRLGAMVVAIMGIPVLGACSSEGPEAGVTVEDVQQLEEQINALDERLSPLEEAGTLPEDIDDEAPEAVPDAGDDVFADTDLYVGQDVTVSGEVSEMVATADAGTAFRISGDVGNPILVVSTTPQDGLQTDDVVRVSGALLVLREDTFEQQFGIAPGEVFEDPESFFGEEEDQVGIAADDVEVLPEGEG